MAQQPKPKRTCDRCGVEPAETRYQVPLCRKCRNEFVERSLPDGVVALLLLLLVVFVFAMVRTRDAREAGIAYQHAVAEEKAGNYPSAISDYETVLSHYPGITKVMIRLAVTSHRAGDDQRASQLVNLLYGQSMSGEELHELQAVTNEIDAKQKASSNGRP